MSFESNESGFSGDGFGGTARSVVVSVVVLVGTGLSGMTDTDLSSCLAINQMHSVPTTNTNTAAAAASGIHGTFGPLDGGGGVWNATGRGPDGGGGAVCETW